MNIISEEKLKLFSEHNNEYLSNSPFPNIYFKDFFNPDFLKAVLNEFPDLSKRNETVKFKDVNQLKNASVGEELLGPKTKVLIHYLHSEPFLNLKEDILMTYGDGLSSIPIKKLVNFHKKNNSLLTISAVRPKQRYGILKIKNDKVDYFDNSNKKSNIYINGGFHIVSREAVNKIKNDNTYWEKEPMNYFVKKKKLFAFKYDGFWKSLDTLKDKKDFNQMYNQNKCYWKFKK